MSSDTMKWVATIPPAGGVNSVNWHLQWLGFKPA
jgi:hypothetical protein